MAAAAGLFAVAAAAPVVVRAAPEGFKTKLTPDEALRALHDGNERFAADAPFRPEIGSARRAATARGQGPFASIVSCADSRVAPELVFSRGIGELFVVRTAGNIADAVALGSVEYSVAVLGSPLLVVMGHASCGAVAAAVDVVEKGTTFPGVIGEMVQPIIPAVLEARRMSGGTLLDNSIVSNAKRVANRLVTQSSVLQEAVRGGKLKVAPARYDLDDGDVDFSTCKALRGSGTPRFRPGGISAPRVRGTGTGTLSWCRCPPAPVAAPPPRGSCSPTRRPSSPATGAARC
jgi:carbonic anhydrase